MGVSKAAHAITPPTTINFMDLTPSVLKERSLPRAADLRNTSASGARQRQRREER
jgi:hypothetical protein